MLYLRWCAAAIVPCRADCRDNPQSDQSGRCALRRWPGQLGQDNFDLRCTILRCHVWSSLLPPDRYAEGEMILTAASHDVAAQRRAAIAVLIMRLTLGIFLLLLSVGKLVVPG